MIVCKDVSNLQNVSLVNFTMSRTSLQRIAQGREVQQ